MVLPIIVAEHIEVLSLIDNHKLYGTGLGWVDTNLIASCILSRCEIWTLDNKLKNTAVKLGLLI